MRRLLYYVAKLGGYKGKAPQHLHRKRTQVALDYVTIQWCGCGDAYRSRPTIGNDRKWNTWHSLESWMMDEPI